MKDYHALNKASDEELMLMYQRDQYQAFELLYLRYKDRVYSYLAKRLQENSMVEEVFQNAFLKVHKQRDNYQSQFLFAQWLFVLVRSEMLDYLKKKRPHEVPYIEQASQEQELEAAVGLEDINEAKHLSSMERAALTRRFFSDEDYSDISRALSTSENNARKLVSRGINKMKKAFGV